VRRGFKALAVAQVIKRTAKGAALSKGVQERVSPHWLRHAHASHALDNKAQISLVQQTLSHGSLKTTSIYAHVQNGRLLAALS
jgi:integrase/recombinase XerD